jgi:hypothetical protein
VENFIEGFFRSDLLYHISDYIRNTKKISRVRQQPPVPQGTIVDLALAEE